MPAHPCPCQSGKPFSQCCAPILAGERLPGTAEALMRSRYTAFAMRDEAWLRASWHPDTRPDSLDLAAEPVPKWIGLSIRQARQDGPDRATVEFVARYRIGGRAHRLHETSRFVREDERWYYVDGTLHET